MKYYVRIWVQPDGNIIFINSSDLPIEMDAVNISPSTVFDLTVDAEYKDAEWIREHLTIDGENVRIADENIIDLTLSSR